MQTGLQVPVKSQPGSDFTEALAAGAASAMYNLGMAMALWRRSLLQALSIVSVNNCSWEVNLFASATGNTTNPATDAWLGRWQFVEADGVQIGGAGLFRYLIEGIAMPYADADGLNSGIAAQTVHVILVNRSSVNTKTAGAPGALQMTLSFEYMGVNQ